jgi:hypothetical protein
MKTPYAYGWQATTVTGEVFQESPELSSSSLDREDIKTIAYIPQTGWPVIYCDIDLDEGEKFIRHWTVIQPLNAKAPARRVFVLGYETMDLQQIRLFIDPAIDLYLTLTDDELSSPPWDYKEAKQIIWLADRLAVIPQLTTKCEVEVDDKTLLIVCKDTVGSTYLQATPKGWRLASSRL